MRIIKRLFIATTCWPDIIYQKKVVKGMNLNLIYQFSRLQRIHGAGGEYIWIKVGLYAHY